MAWKEVDIKVIIEDPDADPPKFRLECPELPKIPNTDHDFRFSNDGHEGFLLNYILQGNAHGYRFPDDETQALYSARGVQCPREPGQWHQFQAREVKPGNKILVVRNFNQKGSEGRFGYTLRVTQAPHVDDPDFIELDPGGDNTNGHGFSSSVQTATADTFVVAGAAATAIYLTMAGSDLIDSNVSLGTALLIALTVGFGIAALFFRFVPRR